MPIIGILYCIFHSLTKKVYAIISISMEITSAPFAHESHRFIADHQAVLNKKKNK